MERELDHRNGDGIDVTLLWDEDADSVLVAVENEHTGDFLRIAVERADALDAFHHPFAYARKDSRERDLAAPCSPLEPG